MKNSYTVVIPAYNEEPVIGEVLADLKKLPGHERLEIIVVNDSSTDGTAAAAKKFPVTLLENVYNFGYGYSLKRGISAAANDHIIIIDADGSYPVAALPKLITEYERGFDMVVGARQGKIYQGSFMKRVARFWFRLMAEFATGRTIPDINSGCRVFRKDAALRFFHTLSTGFSFTTTVTLAFMLNAYSVRYLPIEYHKRTGSSKVRYLRDTLRSAQIITESITFYNPLKMFLFLAAVLAIAGIVAVSISLFSVPIAFLFFLTVAGCLTLFSVGLIAVLLRFARKD